MADYEVVIEKINTLTARMDKTESKTDQNTEDIQDLKQNKASTDEKFNRVFELLGEIKDAIQRKNERLPALMYTIAGVVAGGLIVGVIMWLITKWNIF